MRTASLPASASTVVNLICPFCDGDVRVAACKFVSSNSVRRLHSGAESAIGQSLEEHGDELHSWI